MTCVIWVSEEGLYNQIEWIIIILYYIINHGTIIGLAFAFVKIAYAKWPK